VLIARSHPVSRAAPLAASRRWGRSVTSPTSSSPTASSICMRQARP